MAQKAQTKRTIDREEIREWAEERGGMPSAVATARAEDGNVVLRIDFGEKDEALEQISWDDFFRIFEENDLAFVYEEVDQDGDVSYFCKFVARGPEDEMAEGDPDMQDELLDDDSA